MKLNNNNNNLIIGTAEEASQMISRIWVDRSRYLHFFLIKKRKKNYRRYLQTYVSCIPFFKNKYIHENVMLFEFSWKHKIEENKEEENKWGSINKTKTFYPDNMNKKTIMEQYAPGFMPFYLYDIKGIYLYNSGFSIIGGDDDFDLYAFIGNSLDRTKYPLVSYHTYPDIYIDDSYFPPLLNCYDFGSFQSLLSKDLLSCWEKYPTLGESIDDIIPTDHNIIDIMKIGQREFDLDF